MFRPPCRGFHLAPSQRSSPQAISHGFPSVHVVASISLFFLRFPLRPPCRRFHPAPSQRSSPKLFPTVSPPVVASISLPPNGPLLKLFATVSRPSTLSSLPHRSFPTELSPSYFTRFPLRPPCRRFHLAPSQRSSPQAISHDFPSVHPVVASVSLLPNEALPKLFPTVSPPSTLPMELSPSYFLRFPLRPPCPQAISHGFPSVHPVVASVSLPSRQSKRNENPSIGDAFGKKPSHK